MEEDVFGEPKSSNTHHFGKGRKKGGTALALWMVFSWSDNRPRSIYQYSSMAPRLSGKNCKFFKVLFVPQFPKET